MSKPSEPQLDGLLVPSCSQVLSFLRPQHTQLQQMAHVHVILGPKPDSPVEQPLG